MSLRHPTLRPRTRLVAGLALLAATGAALAAPGATRTVGGGSPDSPVRCELEIADRGGSVELNALASAGKATRGDYSFRVSGRGTDIRQGGPFTLAAGESTKLGAVTLGGQASAYDIELSLRVGGRDIPCAEGAGNRA